MKKNNLINGLFATLLIASPIAGADEKYPAADFQPQVVFQDNDYIAKNNQTAKLDTKVEQGSSEVDPKYPAANFSPQVVYSDPNYKPSVSSSSASSEKVTNENDASVAIENSSVATTAKAESQSNYLIGLIALGLVGAFLFKSQFKCGAKKPESKTVPVSKSGLTGVSRYLNKVSGTGVSRYLEKQVKSAGALPSTGVAKYIAKQVSVAKSTAAGAATGVEKYMRNRG